MTLEIVQARLTNTQIKTLDRWIKDGEYASRSEAVRNILQRHIESKRR